MGKVMNMYNNWFRKPKEQATKVPLEIISTPTVEECAEFPYYKLTKDHTNHIRGTYVPPANALPPPVPAPCKPIVARDIRIVCREYLPKAGSKRTRWVYEYEKLLPSGKWKTLARSINTFTNDLAAAKEALLVCDFSLDVVLEHLKKKDKK